MKTQQPLDAEIKTVKTISTIWFVPIVALLIGGWMVYYHISNQGPTVTILFNSAEGMEAGKTKIKSRSVTIGEVETIKLNDQDDGVIVTARMSKNTEKMLMEDSKFWVVSPKVALSGITGLDTLISGVYIELSPGSSKQGRNEFTALNSPPITPKGTPGLQVTLISDKEFAYSQGDPIIYKGLTVGKIEEVHFNINERAVYYNAFIHAPYHELLTNNTRFWDASGLVVDLNAEGISLKTGSLQTILTNGVTFGIPDGMPLGTKINELDSFQIFDDYQGASNARYKYSLQYVMLVSDTIRGLSVGAPVEYRGVTVGEVSSVELITTDPSIMYSEAVRIPVLLSIQPGRIGLPDNEQGMALMKKHNTLWIKEGLRASLKTGSLLTGSLFVELQHFDLPRLEKLETYQNYPVIPTVKDQYSQLIDKVELFVDKLNGLPLDELTGNANVTLVNAASLLSELQHTSQNLDKLLVSAEQQGLIKQLRVALDSFETLSQDFSSGSQGYEGLQEAMKSISDVMYELKPLLEQLKHKPNGLIFDSGSQDLEPKKHSEVNQ
ncbi:intermembrane transport protein PqiB [Shewanella schlegeliana]|uniref:Intermembrane transport protein PqiB n=1 Tax=Shewanella schlegeliana TaxID=190308 RepID=A0ABS1T185_9GAMM|nr:intermembrane transport protein PqiB [Shewanella schlegeliana]MBL4914350.1 intermembrane transport protein PqiB [Shewanella schlegeliana]MCL1109427.1 intermembrane transport protein PqiB [Shewanella schlegeliana]GIU32040.1 paraquat-inducible protein B [Shewanella schlegeliana]